MTATVPAPPAGTDPRSGPSGRPGKGRKAGKADKKAAAPKAPRNAPHDSEVGLIGRGILTTRRAMHDWLDRPMTSVHLILAIFALLLAIGLLMVLSSSAITSYRKDGSSFSVFQSQIMFAALGLVAFLFALRMPVRVMRSASTVMLLVSLGLLVIVLIPGIGARLNGARSWIKVTESIGFQPAEIAKLALLLWSAHVLASRRSELGSLRQLLIPIIPVTALMAGLIMLQPDFGTTVTLAIVLMSVLYFAGAPLWIFGSVGLLGLAGLGYMLFSSSYRMARLQALVNPELYPNSSYQLRQSLYGLGNGGLFGVGLGGSRAKWSWLPNADSDFIFAIIGEELGLIGAGLVLVLFGLLAYTGMRIARRNVDPFIKIVAGSCTVWLVGQAAINIGYVIGLLPTTGLTLPMISAGGTSLVVTMVVFGLLANFARREPQAAAALYAKGPGPLLRFLGLGVVRPESEIEPAGKVRRRERRALARAGKRAQADKKRAARAAKNAHKTAGAATQRAAATGGTKSAAKARSAKPAPPARKPAPPARKPAARTPAPAGRPAPSSGGSPSAGSSGRPRQQPSRGGRPADPRGGTRSGR